MAQIKQICVSESKCSALIDCQHLDRSWFTEKSCSSLLFQLPPASFVFVNSSILALGANQIYYFWDTWSKHCLQKRRIKNITYKTGNGGRFSDESKSKLISKLSKSWQRYMAMARIMHEGAGSWANFWKFVNILILRLLKAFSFN